jgi:hypothetical protein
MGVTETKIPAKATKLKAGPESSDALRLVPYAQMLCRSEICVPCLSDFTHQATCTPSLKEYRIKILVIAEAIARRTAGWILQSAVLEFDNTRITAMTTVVKIERRSAMKAVQGT